MRLCRECNNISHGMERDFVYAARETNMWRIYHNTQIQVPFLLCCIDRHALTRDACVVVWSTICIIFLHMTAKGMFCSFRNLYKYLWAYVFYADANRNLYVWLEHCDIHVCHLCENKKAVRVAGAIPLHLCFRTVLLFMLIALWLGVDVLCSYTSILSFTAPYKQTATQQWGDVIVL